MDSPKLSDIIGHWAKDRTYKFHTSSRSNDVRCGEVGNTHICIHDSGKPPYVLWRWFSYTGRLKVNNPTFFQTLEKVLTCKTWKDLDGVD